LTDTRTLITFDLPAEDAREFLSWCKRKGLNPGQGLQQILTMTRRDRDLDRLFDDDGFQSAFASARGTVDPDTDLEA